MKTIPQKPPRIDETKYAGEWLALHPESLAILAHGKSLKSVREAAAKRGIRDPLMHLVPDSHGYFVGAGEGRPMTFRYWGVLRRAFLKWRLYRNLTPATAA